MKFGENTRRKCVKLLKKSKSSNVSRSLMIYFISYFPPFRFSVNPWHLSSLPQYQLTSPGLFYPLKLCFKLNTSLSLRVLLNPFVATELQQEQESKEFSKCLNSKRSQAIFFKFPDEKPFGNVLNLTSLITP